MAWETTVDDVQIVLSRHNMKVSNDRLQELLDMLDHDVIENGVLYFNTMENQTKSMLEDIEIQLMEEGVIPNKPKLFSMPLVVEDDQWM